MLTLLPHHHWTGWGADAVPINERLKQQSVGVHCPQVQGSEVERLDREWGKLQKRAAANGELGLDGTCQKSPSQAAVLRRAQKSSDGKNWAFC